MFPLRYEIVSCLLNFLLCDRYTFSPPLLPLSISCFSIVNWLRLDCKSLNIGSLVYRLSVRVQERKSWVLFLDERSCIHTTEESPVGTKHPAISDCSNYISSWFQWNLTIRKPYIDVSYWLNELSQTLYHMTVSVSWGNDVPMWDSNPQHKYKIRSTPRTRQTWQWLKLNDQSM